MTVLYGINNCDTIKKAKTWLESNSIDFRFHDYKKQSVEAEFLEKMIALHGVDVIVNKRGTTFRKLSEEQKTQLNPENAVSLLIDNPSMIKRPILVSGDKSLVGFKADEYASFFA